MSIQLSKNQLIGIEGFIKTYARYQVGDIVNVYDDNGTEYKWANEPKFKNAKVYGVMIEYYPHSQVIDFRYAVLTDGYITEPIYFDDYLERVDQPKQQEAE